MTITHAMQAAVGATAAALIGAAAFPALAGEAATTAEIRAAVGGSVFGG